MGELGIAALLCGLLSGGQTEMRHYFPVQGMSPYVRVDCETETHVVEIGMDNNASIRDSVHQASFYSVLTGKTPMVIVIDTDGGEDRYQYETRVVTKTLGIKYGTCSKDFILAWAATSPFRDLAADKSLNDLPVVASRRTACDLDGAFGLPYLN